MPWKRHISVQYLDPDGNAYAMFIDHLHVTDAWGNETSDISLTEEYGGYITILPKKAGIYRLYYKVSDEREASMFLRVATPSVGIFRPKRRDLPIWQQKIMNMSIAMERQIVIFI